MKPFALLVFGIGSALYSPGQDQIHRIDLPGGKMKYEYVAIRERQHLVRSFFKKYDALFDGSSHQFVMTEGSATCVARITKKGFEVIGDSENMKFKCEMAEILIDLWYESSFKNSN